MSKKSAALGSLKLSLDISDQYGRDASAGIGSTPAPFYTETTIEANSETGYGYNDLDTNINLIKF